jgi:Ca2+ transporting ATPase
MDNAYTRTPAEVLQHFQVTEQKGLSESQVNDLRTKHGKNGESGPSVLKSHTAR